MFTLSILKGGALRINYEGEYGIMSSITANQHTVTQRLSLLTEDDRKRLENGEEIMINSSTHPEVYANFLEELFDF